MYLEALKKKKILVPSRIGKNIKENVTVASDLMNSSFSRKRKKEWDERWARLVSTQKLTK